MGDFVAAALAKVFQTGSSPVNKLIQPVASDAIHIASLGQIPTLGIPAPRMANYFLVTSIPYFTATIGWVFGAIWVIIGIVYFIVQVARLAGLTAERGATGGSSLSVLGFTRIARVIAQMRMRARGGEGHIPTTRNLVAYILVCLCTIPIEFIYLIVEAVFRTVWEFAKRASTCVSPPGGTRPSGVLVRKHTDFTYVQVHHSSSVLLCRVVF